ncbi:MAG: hypothetical protein PHX34_05095 [Candidatus Shapirobacteria bacterium]|nr:hypothetical protein [Candidatus Shapirobacteria bacterium]
MSIDNLIRSRFEWTIQNISFICWLIDMEIPTYLIVSILNKLFVIDKLMDYQFNDGVD